MKKVLSFSVSFFALLSLCAAPGVQLKLVSNHRSGLCKQGESVEFTLSAVKDGKLCSGVKASYEMHTDREKLTVKTVTLTGQPLVLKSPLNAPGATFVAAVLLDEYGKRIPKSLVRTGVLMEKEKIVPAWKEPQDFDDFWKQQRKYSDEVPLLATLRNVGRIKNNTFECFDVKIDCASTNPVSGYLTYPVGAAPRSLKAVVCFHGAGCFSAIKTAKPGFLTFNVNAHGIINGQPKVFYDRLYQFNLAGYYQRNQHNRDKIYFREMYIRNMRALDYIKTRPEWNGKDLIVSGGSQGGAQAIAAAALDPAVTGCCAQIPWLCDFGGAEQGRFASISGVVPLRKGKVPPREAAAIPYYDTVNFARRLRCKVFVSAGLADRQSPASSVCAAFNVIPESTPKFLLLNPDCGHEQYVPENEPHYAAIFK